MITRKLMRIVFILLGAALIISARIKGYHMTEGEQLVAFFLDYFVAVMFIFFGLLI